MTWGNRDRDNEGEGWAGHQLVEKRQAEVAEKLKELEQRRKVANYIVNIMLAVRDRYQRGQPMGELDEWIDHIAPQLYDNTLPVGSPFFNENEDCVVDESRFNPLNRKKS